MYRRIVVCTMLSLLLMLLAACGSENSQQTENKQQTIGSSQEQQKEDTPVEEPDTEKYTSEEVELVLQPHVQLTDEDFQRLVVQPVNQKYPNITIQLLRPVEGKFLPDLIAANEIPDIIYSSNSFVHSRLISLGIPEDLNPLIKKLNIDLSKFQANTVDAVTGLQGEILGLPQLINSYALMYKKDIFDKFAVSYPTDGMTWEDVYELGKKLTRSEDGINYRGLDYNDVIRLSSPYSLPLVDPETNQAIIDDKWTDIFKLAKQIQDIPGNRSPGPHYLAQFDVMNPAKSMVMAPVYSNVLTQAFDMEKEGLEWDVVQYPSFPDLPDTNVQLTIHAFTISTTSKHKEAALLAVDAMLSQEAQTDLARSGKVPVLTDESLESFFAQDFPTASEKNLKAFFLSEMATPAPMHEYNDIVTKAIKQAWVEVYNDETDINTALKRAKEQADIQIEAENS